MQDWQYVALRGIGTGARVVVLVVLGTAFFAAALVALAYGAYGLVHLFF